MEWLSYHEGAILLTDVEALKSGGSGVSSQH